jgi:hypothetical protein
MMLLFALLVAFIASATSRAVPPGFSAANLLPTTNALNTSGQFLKIADGFPKTVPEIAFGTDDDDNWDKYVAKGNHLNCIMRASDAGAGFLIDDKRKPPSAASIWSGDLRRE